MNKDEAKIRRAFSEKDQQDRKSKDTWQVFKIMGEFVEGFEKLGKLGPCVTVFGSARTVADSKYYLMAQEIARLLTLEGYGIITGGGPGIMEAANKGAQLAKGTSVGLNIKLPFEQSCNPYIDSDKNITFDYENFTILNEVHNLNDEGWDNELTSKLWRYNLNYFDCCKTHWPRQAAC